MPGYLFTYRKFKNMYETPIVRESNESVVGKLKMLIEPFILRRSKKEVLTELPDKTVTVLNNEMGEEQRKIYINYSKENKYSTFDNRNFSIKKGTIEGLDFKKALFGIWLGNKPADDDLKAGMLGK